MFVGLVAWLILQLRCRPFNGFVTYWICVCACVFDSVQFIVLKPRWVRRVTGFVNSAQLLNCVERTRNLPGCLLSFRDAFCAEHVKLCFLTFGACKTSLSTKKIKFRFNYLALLSSTMTFP